MASDHTLVCILRESSRTHGESSRGGVSDLKAVRLFGSPRPRPLVKSVRRNQAPGDFSASRNAGLVLADSDLALIIRVATDASLAHDGISPQRIRVPAQAPSDSGE